MIRKLTTILIFICLLFLPQFASSTKIKSHWKNPSVTASNFHFTKVLVMVTIKQELTRKVAEDKAVRMIEARGKAKAVPSYSFLEMNQLDDKELVKSKITDMGFDGALLMRYAGSEDEKKYDEDDAWTNYDYFYGVYCPSCAAVYNSTTPNGVDVYIETMLFSLKDQKLIWSGITETKNPKNPAKVTGEIAEEVIKTLQQEGLIEK
jgi:hypothetical protein